MKTFANDKPIYVQIVDMIEDNINLSLWPEHYKLPDEVNYAKELGVSRGTLRTALDILYDKGLLIRIRGKGTFVKGKKIEQRLSSSLVSSSDELQRQGKKFTTKVIEVKIIDPDKNLKSVLSLKKNEKVAYIERVRFVENKPALYLKNYVALKYCQDILNDDLENERLFEIIKNKYGYEVLWGQRYFRAINADNLIANRLKLKKDEAVMLLQQTAFTYDNKPLEYSELYLNSQLFELMAVVSK